MSERMGSTTTLDKTTEGNHEVVQGSVIPPAEWSPDATGDEGPASLDHSNEAPIDVDASSPETEIDQTNRDVDREILGKSVRTKLAINESAKNAVSKTELLWAQTKNAVGSPLRKIREFRKNRAEKSLQRRQSRHDKKFSTKLQTIEGRLQDATRDHEAKIAQEQAAIDSMQDGWLKNKRQNKLDSKNQKGKAKIENRFSAKKLRAEQDKQDSQARITNYEQGTVSSRREKHQRSTDVAKERLAGAETSAEERQKNIEMKREKAISDKELAHARKALRHELRKQGATMRERRQAMAELFTEDGEGQLRDIGRKMVGYHLAERARQASESRERVLESNKKNTENLLTRARETMQSLPDRLVQNGADQEKYSALSQQLGEKIKALSDADDINNPEYAQLHKDKLEADTALARLKQAQLQMERQHASLPSKIAELNAKLVGVTDQLEAQRLDVAQNQAASESAKASFDGSLNTVLNPDNTKKEN